MADVWYTAADAARWENYRRFELLFEGGMRRLFWCGRRRRGACSAT